MPEFNPNYQRNKRGRYPVPALVYHLLFALQTLAASFLFWTIFPVFKRLVARLGQTQNIDLGTQAAVAAGTIALQGLYWARYNWVDIRAPFGNALVAHLVMFASRASFFFAGVLFSTLFFRHLPELDSLPPLGQALTKGLIVFSVLFALYCYSRELERLGRAIEKSSLNDAGELSRPARSLLGLLPHGARKTQATGHDDVHNG
ncbi:hypothetical protein ACWGS9_05570 [Bradyrhizobium sp. Arg314]